MSSKKKDSAQDELPTWTTGAPIIAAIPESQPKFSPSAARAKKILHDARKLRARADVPITPVELASAVGRLLGGKVGTVIARLPADTDPAGYAKSEDVRTIRDLARGWLNLVNWSKVILDDWIDTAGEKEGRFHTFPEPVKLPDALASYDFKTPLSLDEALVKIGIPEKSKAARRERARDALAETYITGAAEDRLSWAEAQIGGYERAGIHSLGECIAILQASRSLGKSRQGKPRP